MEKIIGIEIHNFGILKHVKMGVLYKDSLDDEFGSMVTIIGLNGSGKSTFADVFQFILDAISSNVEAACDAGYRGGYDQLVSQGSHEPIRFKICYKQDADSMILTYEFSVAKDRNGRPYVGEEKLRQYGVNDGEEQLLLSLARGKGFVSDKRAVTLSEIRQLGIVTLGALKEYPIVAGFLSYIKSWGTFQFTASEARQIQFSSFSPYLNRVGSNLNSVVYRMRRENPAGYQKVLERIRALMPHITEIRPEKLPDGQMMLEFMQEGFPLPFYSNRMSDGVLELLAYYLLLYENNPRQVLFLEDVDRNLHHHNLSVLAADIAQVVEAKNTRQIFVSTHTPFVFDALRRHVWVFEKGNDGFAIVKRMFAAHDSKKEEKI